MVSVWGKIAVKRKTLYLLYIIFKEKSTLNIKFIREFTENILKSGDLQTISIMKNDEKRAPCGMAAQQKGKIGVLLKILTGFFAGLVNGLFGGGGGMIVVPSLRYLLKYRTANAHATAIAIILPVSVLSGVFYTAFGNFDSAPVLFTALGAIGGGVIGAFLLKKLSSLPITVVFSLVMAAAGVKMLFF